MKMSANNYIQTAFLSMTRATLLTLMAMKSVVKSWNCKYGGGAIELVGGNQMCVDWFHLWILAIKGRLGLCFRESV